ncbi:MAG: histidine kinase, partial [Methylobacteriaceae bacterium]|nr:histidine kinase [Methylobacteriaceae bacterium]
MPWSAEARAAAAGVALVAFSATLVAGPQGDDAAIATSLAEMLRAGRTVISNNQSRINDPS